MTDSIIDDGGPLLFSAEGLEAYRQVAVKDAVVAGIKAGLLRPARNAPSELQAASGSRVFRVHRDENGRIAAIVEEIVP